VFGETVVEEPTCPWNLVCDENGNCTENTVDPDESTLLNPCDVLGEDGACHGPLNQDDVCVNMDGQDSTCHGPLAEGQLRPEEQGFSSTQLGLYGAVGVATIAGLWYGVPWFYKKYIKKAEVDPTQGPQQPPVDDNNTSVNTDATDTTDGTTTDPIIDGNTTGGQTDPTDGPTVGGQPAPLVLEQGSYVLKNGNFYEVEQQNELTVPGANSTDDALYYAAGDHYLQKHFQHQGQNYEIVNIAQRQQKNAGGCSGCRGTHAVTDIIARDTAQAQNAPTVTIAWANAPTQMEVVTTPGL